MTRISHLLAFLLPLVVVLHGVERERHDAQQYQEWVYGDLGW